MAVAELFALKEQMPSRATKSAMRDARGDPAKRSLAKTMRALRGCLRNLNENPGKDLASQLRDAITDSYDRRATKHARYRPPNPDKKPLGDPKLRRLTAQENQKLTRVGARKTV